MFLKPNLMPKDKLYKQLEAGRSRCLFWKPSSNSICSPHDKTCQSQLYHVHHQQSLHHGHWYIRRCKWLDLPRKIQYSKYHTPPAVLPFEGNQLWWCKISLPRHKVVPPHSVRQFHWPAKIACAYRVGTNKMPIPKVSEVAHLQRKNVHLYGTKISNLIETT